MSHVNLNLSKSLIKIGKKRGYKTPNDLAIAALNEWYRQDIINHSKLVSETTK